MIIQTGVQIGPGIKLGDFPVAPLDLYTNLTSEDGVTQLLTEAGDGLVIE
jgi:hypothetical protein